METNDFTRINNSKIWLEGLYSFERNKMFLNKSQMFHCNLMIKTLQSYEDLKQSEANSHLLFRTAIDQSRVGIYIFSAECLNITLSHKHYKLR
ncbi:unnamed protein product [Schistosoma margrebowiei]|uniref:Uncharacterized protein n=1 Tax=Schistosoma margrebowiei TaxID=48269 RepID=A0A183MJH0_9TREM|nr:unnamed protein product [Schistosoma margrebowiei]